MWFYITLKKIYVDKKYIFYFTVIRNESEVIDDTITLLLKSEDLSVLDNIIIIGDFNFPNISGLIMNVPNDNNYKKIFVNFD